MDETKTKVSEGLDLEMAKAYWKKHTYIEKLPENITPFRELLEGYSKIPPAEVDALLLHTVSFASQNSFHRLNLTLKILGSVRSFGR